MLAVAKWRRWAVGSLAAIMVAAVFISACGGGSSSSPPTQGATPTPPTTATTQSGATAVVSSNLIKSALVDGLGIVLIDADGFTLYHLSSDSANGSGCTGDCLTAWPPVLIKGSPQAGDGVKTNFLGTISRPEGTQVTYNDFTLYRFSGDKTPGDAKGQRVLSFGGKWTAITTAGVLSQSAPPTTP